MYALGIVGICVGLMALFMSLFSGDPQPGALKTRSIAQNYMVMQVAVQEAMLLAAAKAPTLAAGDALLAGSACVAPLTKATDCDILLGSGRSADINAWLPGAWEVLHDTASPSQTRWKARLQEGKVFVYGVVSPEEMAALREMAGHSPNLALCREGQGAAACLPVLQEQLPDGSFQTINLPSDVQGAASARPVAVHVLRIVP